MPDTNPRAGGEDQRAGDEAEDSHARAACSADDANRGGEKNDKDAAGRSDENRPSDANEGAGDDGEESGARFPRPFENSYAVSLSVAILSLVPYIIVTTAYTYFRLQVSFDIHTGRTGLEIIAGLSTAGYAFGALLGGDLVQRFRQRWLFLLVEGLFVLGSVLAAIAPGTVVYGAGRVLQGFTTGILLVVALPPVIQRFPAKKLPITAAMINLGFFGPTSAVSI